ncbi:MAG: hypothetical protein ACP5MJ_08730, partial [Roseiflexus sp.]
LIGYTALIWSGFMLASLVLNLRWTVAIILIGATVLNVFAWRAKGPPQPLVWLRAQPEALIPPLLALLTGILPLLEYGYPTIIGRGWDTEAYLPMAQHLIDYPLPRIPEAPQSLLRDLVAHPPRIGLTLGFSAFHQPVRRRRSRHRSTQRAWHGAQRANNRAIRSFYRHVWQIQAITPCVTK